LHKDCIETNDGGIVLGDNMLRLITYQCVGKWISTGLPCIYANSWPHILNFELRRTFRNVFTAYFDECLYTVGWQNGYRRKI